MGLFSPLSLIFYHFFTTFGSSRRNKKENVDCIWLSNVIVEGLIYYVAVKYLTWSCQKEYYFFA